MTGMRCKMASFAVVGKEGSTWDGAGFVQALWQEANGAFDQIAHLAIRDEKGRPIGIWGAMTDFSRTFQPWEDDFSKGLYLAGVQCAPDAAIPAGWAKWIVPAFEYCCIRAQGSDAFKKALAQFQAQGDDLAGAVQEFYDAQTGACTFFFPIARL
jgi:hypothetical protein